MRKEADCLCRGGVYQGGGVHKKTEKQDSRWKELDQKEKWICIYQPHLTPRSVGVSAALTENFMPFICCILMWRA